MQESNSPDLARTALFGLWGLFTLILLFCVVMLVREMMRQGGDPLAAVDLGRAEVESPNAARPAAASVETREIQLYFAGTAPFSLTSEARRVEVGFNTAQNCRSAIRALIDGPAQGLSRVLPPDTEIRGVYMREGGELVVDFNRALETGTPRSAAAEWLLRQALTRTLSQFELIGRDNQRVATLRLLMEGAPLGDSFPAHLSFVAPIPVAATPDPAQAP